MSPSLIIRPVLLFYQCLPSFKNTVDPLTSTANNFSNYIASYLYFSVVFSPKIIDVESLILLAYTVDLFQNNNVYKADERTNKVIFIKSSLALKGTECQFVKV